MTNRFATPTVSVIVPTYNRPELTERAVRALFHQDFPKDDYEVIVVDSSTDARTRSVLEKLEKSAPCSFRWFTKDPEGPGPSRNLGLDHARGQMIAFTDSDCEPVPTWLRSGLAAFHDGIGLVQGRIVPNPNDAHGVFKGYVEVNHEGGLYECANMFYRREAIDRAGRFIGHPIPKTAAGTMVVRRLMPWIHSFDRPLGGEDVDLAWRVKRHGWKSCFASDALVYHARNPISPWQWLLSEQLFIWPRLVRIYPELRQFCYRTYFFSRIQASVVAGVIGSLLAFWSPWALAAWIPYVVLRALEPTRTLQGFKRLLRPVIYFPKDLMSFMLLLAGSIRYRSVLL